MAREFFSGYRYDLEDIPACRLMSCGTDWLKSVGDALETVAIDPRDWFQIRNQGPVGSCRGHSLAAVGEALFKMGAGEIDLDEDGLDYELGKADDRFSPAWCYYVTQKYDGIRGDRGSTMLGGIKTATKDGIAPELKFPYRPEYDPRIPDEAYEAAERYKVQRTFVPSGPEDEEALWEWFQSGQGIAEIGKLWPLKWRSLGGEDYVYDGGRIGGMGGHATALLGCVQIGDEWCYCDANSHSDEAQDAGFFYITRDGMRTLLEHDNTVVVAHSDLTVPRRRVFRWSEKGHNPFIS